LNIALFTRGHNFCGNPAGMTGNFTAGTGMKKKLSAGTGMTFKSVCGNGNQFWANFGLVYNLYIQSICVSLRASLMISVLYQL